MIPDDSAEAQISASNMVYDAVCELFASEQPANRDTIAQLTGLTLQKVDERAKALCTKGRLVRISKGHYEPVVRHAPARPISRTDLPDGRIKIEIEDDVLTLTPREARTLSRLMAGDADDLRSVQLRREHSKILNGLSIDLLKIARSTKHALSPKGTGQG